MVVSGMLMFGIFQGDRFVVGLKYSMADLGTYAVAGALTLLPAGAMMNISGSIMLPLLSPQRDHDALFRVRLKQCSETMGLLSALYSVIMMVAGGTIVAIVFGAKYSDAGALVGWLGLAQSLRLLRNVPTVAAMAKGDTKNLMFSNLCRLSGLAAAVPAVLVGFPLSMVAACAALGEAIALVGSFGKFSRRHGIPNSMHVTTWAVTGTFIAVSGGLALFGISKLEHWVPLAVAGILVLCAIAVNLALFQKTRGLLVEAALQVIQRASSVCLGIMGNG
jgi:O-antigen/teichoic acid export membrane protein